MTPWLVSFLPLTCPTLDGKIAREGRALMLMLMLMSAMVMMMKRKRDEDEDADEDADIGSASRRHH